MNSPVVRLPDPRPYAADAAVHPFHALADAELSAALRAALTSGRDAGISAALPAAPSRDAYARVWHAACDAAHHINTPDDAAVVARIFALPLIIVTGSRRPANLPGVVPDIDAVRSLLEQHGALGRTRNFGIGNALCDYETLMGVTPAEIHAWTQAAGSVQRELAPAPIQVAEPGEHVHLRFLVGAGITPAAEASFIEAASNIGTWGMQVTKALSAQLAQAGVDVLPMPRPPMDLLRAAHAGRAAQLEAAFNLFASNALRKFRSVTGDPVVIVSAHDDCDIRVTFSSHFDDTMVEGFRWPLDSLDEVDAVAGMVQEMMAICRVNDVRVITNVRSAVDNTGQPVFVTVRSEADRDTSARH